MNKWKLINVRPLFIAIGSYAVIAGILAFHFPPVNPDEILSVVTANNFIEMKGARYSLNEDVYAPEGKDASVLSNLMVRPAYCFWLGMGTHVLPWGWWFARISSIASGMVFLFFLGLIGSYIGGKKTGVLSIAVALLHTPFWMASSVVNELILVAMATAIIMYLILMINEKEEWRIFALGVLIPLPILIHTYAAILIIPLIIFFIANHGFEYRKMISKLIAGIAAGSLIVFLAAPWKEWLQYQTILYSNFSTPALFRNGNWEEWASHITGFFFREVTFYYPGAEKQAWGLSQSVWPLWVAMAITIAVLLLYKSKGPEEKRLQRSLLWGFFTTLGLLLLLAGRNDVFYLTILLPFTILLVTMAIKRLLESESFLTSLTLGLPISVAFISSMCIFAIFVGQYTSRYLPHNEVAKNLKSIVGINPGRIMAPNVFFFDFPNDDFRDVGAFGSSRYYTDGRFEPREWIGRWKPRYIVADYTFLRIFKKSANPFSDFANMMQIPLQYKGKVESGMASGTLYVLELQWPGQDNSDAK